jgi:hypothetical protein
MSLFSQWTGIRCVILCRGALDRVQKRYLICGLYAGARYTFEMVKLGCRGVMDMSYNKVQLQHIVQWLTQRTPRLMEDGCPICGSPAAGFGVEQFIIPDFPIPLLAVACRTCAHVMLFNEEPVLASLAQRAVGQAKD